MTTPHLAFLGGAHLRMDGDGPPIAASRRHPVALLALLATAPGSTVSRGRLVGLLWPEADESTARNRLSTVVHRVRRTLGEEALTNRGDDLHLVRGAITCDVWSFTRALEREDWEDAVRLHAGPFLEGFALPESPAFQDRMDRVRLRLRDGYRGALERLAEAREAEGRPAEAANWWRRRSADDPYDSRVTGRLVEALSRAGNRSAAVRAAEAHQDRLREELGLDPDPGLQRIVERVRGLPPAPDVEAPRGGTGGSLRRPSVSLLPLRTVAGAPPAGLTHGLRAELLGRLARVSGVRVVAAPVDEAVGVTDRRDWRSWGVDWILEGDVQESRGEVKVHVRLWDARSGCHLWGAGHHRVLDEAPLFEIQEEISRSVTEALEARLGTGVGITAVPTVQ